jgi:DUF4097 and DUF4098 domain-containing protein YvlB
VKPSLTSAAAGLALASALLWTAPAPAASHYVFSWHGQLEAGATLDVSNINGPVSVVQAGGGEARVRAGITSEHGDAQAVKIQVTRDGNTLHVCPLYPGDDVARDCRHNGEHNDNDDTRVDFSIELPKGVRLRAATVNGNVSARGLDSDVDARSVNQNITVSTSGAANAKTVNGSIDATLGVRRWSGTLTFETVNGHVAISLPRTAAFTLKADSLTGGIRFAGFPLAEAPNGGFIGHTVRGTVGSDGGTLVIKTVNGPIALSAR